MNPLQFIFFFSILFDDYFFKEARLFNFYIFLLAVYWISSFFSSSENFTNTSRKLQMALYSQSEDPTVISKIKLRSEKAKKCIDALSKKYDKKISWTLYTAKALGNALVSCPDILNALKFSKVNIISK